MKPIAEALDEIAKMSAKTKPREIKITIGHEPDIATVSNIEAHNCNFIYGEVIPLIERSAYKQILAERDALITALKVADEALKFYAENDFQESFGGSTCIEAWEAQTKIAEILEGIK